MDGRKWYVLTDTRGTSLLELVMVIGLIVVLVTAAVNMLFFTQRSWTVASLDAAVRQDAQLFLIQVEKEIRAARRISVIDDGNGLWMNTVLNGESRVVQYELSENALKRGVSDPEEEPVWAVRVENVIPLFIDGNPAPLFSLTGNKVSLKFVIEAPHVRFPGTIEINTTYTRRSKEVM